jgi:hypothetical protein
LDVRVDNLPAVVAAALTSPARWDDLVSAIAALDDDVRTAPTAEHVDVSARLVELLSTRPYLVLADHASATHALACAATGPSPDALVDWLLRLQLDYPDAPDVRLDAYAVALGPEGFASYRARAVAAFSQLPVIGFGEPGRYDRTRWALLRIMEELAEFTEDVDLRVLLLTKDLSSGWHYLQVATVLFEADRWTEALEWVRRGLAATGGHGAAARLADLGVTACMRMGRPDLAAELRQSW